jgi:quinol-cytochrome oxidoreductase complex cytochrome b subunit
MSGHSTYEPKTGFERWLDTRLPIVRFASDTILTFPTPKNLNYWWTFGGILSLMLGMQIVTGIILAMHYVPHVDYAFDSIQRIMRDVNYGWLIRNLHANGASMFFLAAYIHIFRNLYYGSYKAPREVLWILGCVIYLLMIITAFMGYVLPWGQMSFHGAVVITNLIGAVPVVGPSITTWLWGGFAVDDPTLNRFFSLHYLLPFMIAGVVALHIWALHVPGNNNPTGVNVKSKEDTVPFHPYYTVKDGFAISVFLIMYAVFVFYLPDALGDVVNYVKANPLQTPQHIVPEWYLLPFYAILRGHRDPVRVALARHLEGAVHALPADRQALLLHLHLRLPGAGPLRGARPGRPGDPQRLGPAAAGLEPQQLRLAVAHRGPLLLRLLLGDHPAPGAHRDTAAGAGVDLLARPVASRLRARRRRGVA